MKNENFNQMCKQSRLSQLLLQNSANRTLKIYKLTVSGKQRWVGVDSTRLFLSSFLLVDTVYTVADIVTVAIKYKS